jgi:hypothetical protein
MEIPLRIDFPTVILKPPRHEDSRSHSPDSPPRRNGVPIRPEGVRLQNGTVFLSCSQAAGADEPSEGPRQVVLAASDSGGSAGASPAHTAISSRPGKPDQRGERTCSDTESLDDRPGAVFERGGFPSGA